MQQQQQQQQHAQRPRVSGATDTSSNLPPAAAPTHLLQLSATRAVMSWYSSHEKDANGKTITAIYMADLEIIKDAR